MREVLLARVGELDRRAGHLPGDFRAQRDVLELQPMAEAATGVLLVKAHLLGLVAGDGRHLLLREARHLVGDPHVHAVRADLDDGVQRLQRLMRHVGGPVLGLDDLALRQRLLDVAVVAPFLVQPLGRETGGDRGPMPRYLGRIGRRPPFALDGLDGLEGAPGVVGHRRHAVGDGDDPLHAAQGLGPRVVVAVKLAALARVHLHGGVYHAVH